LGTELSPTEQVLEWSLEEWSQRFYEVYKKHDKPRHYSGIWLHVLNHASKVAEEVRLNRQEYVLFHLGNAFVWICAFAHRISEDIQTADKAREGLSRQIGPSFTSWILRKYPLRCHTCGCSTCICATRRDIAELRSSNKVMKELYQEIFGKQRDSYLLQQAKTIAGKMNELGKQPLRHLIKSFMEIYGGTLWGIPYSDICFHFLEEIGEVSVEIGSLEDKFGYFTAEEWKQKQEKIDFSSENGDTYDDLMFGLTRELADVFSWTCGLLYKCYQEWHAGDIPPEEYLVRLYLGHMRKHMEKMEKQEPDKFARIYTKEIPYTQTIQVVCAWCQEPTCKEDCGIQRVTTRRKKIHDHRKERSGYEMEMLG
jgi:hypothetical protein